MSKRKGQEFPTPEETPRFHDTYQFLRRYRDATYSLKVVVHQMENQFKVQYGSSIDEFLARLRVALRRSRTDQTAGPSQSSLYQNGELRIDYAAGCAYMGGKEIHLTPIEYKLLCVLAKNTGKVLTHNYILKEVRGTALAADIPSLRVFMATLRKKIERDPSAPRYIQTHIGVGYRMIRQ